jgi:hypothetical protein
MNKIDLAVKRYVTTLYRIASVAFRGIAEAQEQYRMDIDADNMTIENFIKRYLPDYENIRKEYEEESQAIAFTRIEREFFFQRRYFPKALENFINS